MSDTTIFNTQYKTLLTVLATILVLVIGFLWFMDRRNERKLQEHLFELQADLPENREDQRQQPHLQQLQLQERRPRLIF